MSNPAEDKMARRIDQMKKARGRVQRKQVVQNEPVRYGDIRHWRASRISRPRSSATRTRPSRSVTPRTRGTSKQVAA